MTVTTSRDHNREFRNLELYAEYHLDGADPYIPQKRAVTAQQTADNVARAFGRLLDVLYRNGVVTEAEVGEVFEDESLRIVENAD